MSQPWYADGLRFQCTQCGDCCTGSPGYVWLAPRDQKAIAKYLGLDLDEFRLRYTRLVGEMLSLVEKEGGDCVFLTEGRRCSINAVKPRQCLTFPFWPRLLLSRKNWNETAKACPGIGTGPLYRPEEVDAIGHPESPRELICRVLASKREQT